MERDEVWRRQDEFRDLAKGYADRARSLLSESDDRSVVYAALELRFGLEALIYAHAISYLDELGDPKRLDWQAPKLLEQLLEIDPYADSTVFLRTMDFSTGEQRDEWADRRLDLKKLKKRYYKLGNALHAPSIASIAAGEKRDMSEWRAYCHEIVGVIDDVLASKMAITGGTHHKVFVMNCACGAVIKRRTDPIFVHRDDPKRGSPFIKVRCPDCVQSVQVSLNSAGDNFEVMIDLLAYDCPHEGCGKQNSIWERELVDGAARDCEHCGGRILMSTAIRPVVG